MDYGSNKLIKMDKDEIIKLINTYWRFDNDQDSTSTWHDKQDLISEIEQRQTLPLYSVSNRSKAKKVSGE